MKKADLVSLWKEIDKMASEFAVIRSPYYWEVTNSKIKGKVCYDTFDYLVEVDCFVTTKQLIIGEDVYDLSQPCMDIVSDIFDTKFLLDTASSLDYIMERNSLEVVTYDYPYFREMLNTLNTFEYVRKTKKTH